MKELKNRWKSESPEFWEKVGRIRETMKSTELRIGNLFREEYTNGIIEVVQLETDKIFFSLKFVSQWQAKAIPLTEEWLLKSGFKKCENGWKTLSICNDWTYLSWERLAGIELSVNKHSCMLPNIKYVHQLQNLYFALTGEELTIKE